MLLNMSSKFDFLDAVKGNQVPFPELKSLQNPVEELGSQYLTVCKYLVHKISPSVLDDRWKELAFERILVTGHAELFIYLCSVIQRETSPSFRREFLARLIKLSLETRVLTKLLLSETVKPSLDQTSHGLLSALVSLPQVMSNVFKLSVPKAFIIVNYYPVLVNGVYECTKQAVEHLKLNQDVHLEFLSQLVGRLALNGQANHLWSHLIVAILNSKDDIFLWQRLGRRLVHSSDTDRFIEPLYKEIISSSRSADDIKFFLGDKIEENETIVFLLTQKFLTSYVFENMAAARNLTAYLAASSLSVLKKSVDHLLLVWGSNTSLRYRSYSQNVYLATLLALFARSIERLSTADKDATLKVVMQGIEVHLRSSDHEVRSINLYVGQKLMKKLNKDGPKLDLGLGGDESVMRFKEKLKGTMTIESSSSRKQVPLPKAGKLIEEVGGDKDEYEKELDDLENRPIMSQRSESLITCVTV
ncbi:Telomere length regulation protein TEL2 -like protein [Halotydeus destructor]|nr:Telomere length regulation protein TEL2 -like protein [Halotydeus destructor]